MKNITLFLKSIYNAKDCKTINQCNETISLIFCFLNNRNLTIETYPKIRKRLEMIYIKKSKLKKILKDGK